MLEDDVLSNVMISWSEFLVACCQEASSDQMIMNVYDYLYVHGIGKGYFSPHNLKTVLQAQAFRHKNINISQCIIETFGIEKEDDWHSMKIT